MTRIDVVPGDTPSMSANLSLAPGINLITGEADFRKNFAAPTSLECDLLTVASAVFATDLGVKRGERENVARDLRLTIPVVNLAAFREVQEQLRYLLYRLSHDSWDIRFVQRAGTPEIVQESGAEANGKVLLFSGGLDSLAGAIQFGEAGEQTTLVSHVTANRVVSAAQDGLLAYLANGFGGVFTRYAFRVGGRSKPTKGFPFPTDHEREETQRTRSFLFLVLASLVARRRRQRDVVVIAENGQMAIHLPLTAGRIGAFSTHTAHPEVVHVAAQLLSTVLSYDIRIENPFLYKTKSQAIARVVSTYQDALISSVSCWKASRVSGGKRHCGFCIPCLVRRIAVEYNGTQLDEYQRDIFAADPETLSTDDDGKRNLVDLAEFTYTFSAGQSQAQLEELYPELINPSLDPTLAVAMYRRFATEARAVFGKYPAIQSLLS